MAARKAASRYHQCMRFTMSHFHMEGYRAGQGLRLLFHSPRLPRPGWLNAEDPYFRSWVWPKVSELNIRRIIALCMR
eukprot:2948385-Amphidinium_carterae.1